MSETYLYYDHSKNMLILNSGDFEVKNHITFKDNDKCKFTGNYNSMTNNPLLGTNYIYNNTTTLTGIAAGQLRFNNSTIENSSQKYCPEASILASTPITLISCLEFNFNC